MFNSLINFLIKSKVSFLISKSFSEINIVSKLLDSFSSFNNCSTSFGFNFKNFKAISKIFLIIVFFELF